MALQLSLIDEPAGSFAGTVRDAMRAYFSLRRHAIFINDLSRACEAPLNIPLNTIFTLLGLHKHHLFLFLLKTGAKHLTKVAYDFGPDTQTE